MTLYYIEAYINEYDWLDDYSYSRTYKSSPKKVVDACRDFSKTFGGTLCIFDIWNDNGYIMTIRMKYDKDFDIFVNDIASEQVIRLLGEHA